MRGAQPAPPTRAVWLPPFRLSIQPAPSDGSPVSGRSKSRNPIARPALREGAQIRQISEDRAKFVIECEDDSAIDVTLADPGASVAVRDKTYQVEYLG